MIKCLLWEGGVMSSQQGRDGQVPVTTRLVGMFGISTADG